MFDIKDKIKYNKRTTHKRNFMSTTEIIKSIFKEQDNLNAAISGKEWLKSGNDYMLAASVECAEAFDYLSYKWWKHSEVNIPQLKLEMVDILFFITSQALVEKLSYVYLTDVLFQGFSNGTQDTTVECKSLLLALAEADVVESFRALGRCLFTLGISFEELFNLYIGKSILNHFRKNNGYKSGTYIKNWNNKEDNEVLTEVCQKLSFTSVKQAKEQIYKDLEYAYSLVG